jgi:hypothetical protein
MDGVSSRGSIGLGPPAPSMTYIKWYIFLLLVRHPLLISPPGGLEEISRWRMYNGVEDRTGLTCSVYCHANLNEKEALPRPDSQSISVSYEPGGQESDEVTYSVAIKLHYKKSVIGNKETNRRLIEVPSEAALQPREWLHTSNGKREVELWTNPPMDLFGHYMGLIRLALLDPQSKSLVSGPEFNIEVLYENHKDRPWESEANMLYQEAEMLVQVTTYISRGWRDRWDCIPTSIRVWMEDNPTERGPHARTSY